MTPYYQRNGITLYCGNAADCLSTLENKSIDLIVTDPPYGQSYHSGLRNAPTTQKFYKLVLDGSDDRQQVEDILKASFRTLREARHAYVFGPFDLASLDLSGCVELIWNKLQVGSGNLSQPWGPSHERLSFGVRTSSKANREDGYGKGPARLRRQSILNFSKIHGHSRQHPTQKPVPLLRELIESSSFFSETVLDPFCGVGSTLVAALREGRKAIGIEISEEFCCIAKGRLEREPAFLVGE